MTNEVLQKTASDEQNVSSSNGLEPRLRFPSFDNKWTLTTIGNVCAFTNGKAHEQNVVEYGEYIIVNSKFISSDGVVKKYSNKQICPLFKNDIVMVMSDVPNGKAMSKCFCIDKDNKYTLNQRICALRTKQIPLYYMMQINRNDYFMKFDDGVKQTNLRKDDVLACPVYSTTIKEQTKIADFLSLIDQRIEKQRRLVESLKKYKRGLFLKLYNDSDKSIISFKNIYEMASEGGTPSTSDSENYENGKIPFIKIDDLNQHYLNFAKYFITEKGLKKSSAWIVPENSIIYSNGATIGACSINKIPVTTKQGILGIVPKSNFSVEFLYFFFTSSIFKQKIRAITTKGTMDCAYLKDINGIKISIPDFIAQQKIAKIMVDFENLIERTELSFIYLQNIKKALLQQMFI